MNAYIYEFYTRGMRCEISVLANSVEEARDILKNSTLHEVSEAEPLAVLTKPGIITAKVFKVR